MDETEQKKLLYEAVKSGVSSEDLKHRGFDPSLVSMYYMCARRRYFKKGIA